MLNTVLISGGSRGIGAATVRLFAKRGWRVVFLYRQSARAAADLSRETGAEGYPCDVSDPRAVAETAARVLFSCGHVDALVSNAGIAGFGLLTDCGDEAWRAMNAVNLDGAFYLSRAFLPSMISRKSGALLFVSSVWGVSGASCEAPYSATKAGLIGLTKALCKEVGPSGIRVNCVCPGVIATDMNKNLSEDDLRALSDETPLSRIGRPEEVAEAIYFLCGEDSSFITGQTLCVDGGFIV